MFIWKIQTILFRAELTSIFWLHLWEKKLLSFDPEALKENLYTINSKFLFLLWITQDEKKKKFPFLVHFFFIIWQYTASRTFFTLPHLPPHPLPPPSGGEGLVQCWRHLPPRFHFFFFCQRWVSRWVLPCVERFSLVLSFSSPEKPTCKIQFWIE